MPFWMRPLHNDGTLGGSMAEIRYAPSLLRLAGIFVVLVAPFAVFLWAAPFNLLVVVVSIAAFVRYTGQIHTVLLGPDFMTAHGQRFRVGDIRPGALPGFIGDVYASGSARVGVSSVFLSRAQRSEIARRLAQFQSS